MTTEAQARSKRNYDARNTKSFRIKLMLESDSDVISRLDEQESRQGYIKRLIAEDVASGAEVDESRGRTRGRDGEGHIQIALKLNVHTDKDVISRLGEVGNRGEYIRRLVREDMR